MTSRKKSSGFEFWSCVISAWPWCIFLPNFAQIALGVIDIFRNRRRRPPPSWIFKSCTFGTFRHVNIVVLELYIKFGSNICDSLWDHHTYALDVHLMTSGELTSGFDFWSRGHLRMAVVHLPIKFGVDIYIQSKVIDIFRNWRWRPPPSFAILDFQFMWIWPFRRVDSVLFVFCAKFGSNICYSHWDQRTCASDIHLMTSRELTSGFVFWSRGHLCMAVMHLHVKFGTDVFIECGVIDIFFKSKDGGRRHLVFVWVSHGTTHSASFVARTSCKNFVMIG